MSPVVIIVGPPGAGKTTLAATLAAQLGVLARDSDDDIEATTGMTIADIFIEQGEQRFRDLETEAIGLAIAEHDGVLSLGGGAVIRPESRDLLKPERVVFLDVGLAVAVKRVGMNANRPLLLGNVRSKLKALMDERRPLYEEVATYTIVTDDLDADEVAARVLQCIGESS